MDSMGGAPAPTLDPPLPEALKILGLALRIIARGVSSGRLGQ
jgi:hypothetical protein